jgi:hypothetical protein
MSLICCGSWTLSASFLQFSSSTSLLCLFLHKNPVSETAWSHFTQLFKLQASRAHETIVVVWRILGSTGTHSGNPLTKGTSFRTPHDAGDGRQARWHVVKV